MTEEDTKVLERYALWNPDIDTGKRELCEPCSHCSPDVQSKTEPEIPLRIRGECHCHPCGSCGRD